MATSDGPSLLAQALSLLAQREHTQRELQVKLAKRHAKSTEPSEWAALWARLESLGYLSESRYVEGQLHRRAAQWGQRRLEQALRQKGVSEEGLAQARQALAGTELVRAREVWARKFGQTPKTPQERAKQGRFLLGRGFPPQVVSRLLREIGSPNGMSDEDDMSL